MKAIANGSRKAVIGRFCTLQNAFVSVVVACLQVAVAFHAAGCVGCSKKPSPHSSNPDTRVSITPGMRVTLPTARAAYVTNNGSDSVSVIDRDGDAVVSVPVDLDPEAHEAPHHLAIDAASRHVFVALAFPARDAKRRSGDPHASHGNGSALGKLVRLDLDTLAAREVRDVDENPGDVILTHDKQRVLVTHFDIKRAMDVAARGLASPSTMFAHLAVFDANTMRKLGSRPICVAPHGVTVTADDRIAYVACYGSDELAVVDLQSDGFATSRIPLGPTQGVPGVPRFGPYSATLSPDERVVLLADLEGQDLRVFDRESKRFIPEKAISLSAKAFMPAFVDNETILVPMQAPDGVARVNLRIAKIERRVSFPAEQCTLPHAIRVSKDERAYVVCEGDHRNPGTVLQLDTNTLRILASWRVQVYPDGIAFGDD